MAAVALFLVFLFDWEDKDKMSSHLSFENQLKYSFIFKSQLVILFPFIYSALAFIILGIMIFP